MAATIVRADEGADLFERGVADDVWPEYNKHGDVLSVYWPRLDEAFPEFQFLLYDEEKDDVVAEAYTIPCSWDGTVEDLPSGINGVIEQGFDLWERGVDPNTLSALAIVIGPKHQGRGVSRVMLNGMTAIAAAHGLRNLIAPVRPVLKERYPLAPIERYAEWRRDDGLPFDPWIRLHVRLGGEILRPEPQSLRITGTVGEWEGWTRMAFPESGTYVFPHGLAPLAIDRDADRGSYWEPNVWMRHRVESAARER